MKDQKLHVGDVPVPDIEYKWIRKWGELFSYPAYYTENALKVARRDGAPRTRSSSTTPGCGRRPMTFRR